MEVAPSVAPKPTPTEKGRVRRYAGIFLGAFVRTIAVASALTVALFAVAFFVDQSERSSCNVSVRTIYGELLTYGETGDSTNSGDLVRLLEKDDRDDSVKAIIVDIDSPGGIPVAGEEIAYQLLRMKKPTVAVIRSTGASSAYWAAVGADRIFASPSSDIGSIGVSVSFPDESEKNKKDGIVMNEFASGVFKNIGTPNRPVTPEERTLLEKSINDIYVEFVSAVSRARNIPEEKVKKLADGSTMLGRRALAEGLIDEIGSFAEAREYLRGIISEEPVLCEPDLFSQIGY